MRVQEIKNNWTHYRSDASSTWLMNWRMRFPDSFQYKKCGVNDTIEGSHFRQFFDGAMQFMDDARRDGKRLYVHCAMGISRSPAICIAWLMKEHRWDYATAQAFVKSQRRCICPNPGFVKFLKEYEKDIVTQ
eukprot:TRINITY_DN367_c0_g1_i1.p1 TRINITY_DN367_c0_g1~~TRINITY_DN367_c0_g1_i1.p1  ORF type:complete len:132 (+),score=17.68 TRINITY_DN367_c0_g1_i1:124-519(+)